MAEPDPARPASPISTQERAPVLRAAQGRIGVLATVSLVPAVPTVGGIE